MESTALPGPQFYRFGPFHLDVSERLLLREGEIVPLTPKAFDTLLVLVESGGRLLKKDELIQKIWPGTFVEEVNLAHHISVLRKALGESQNGDRYIQTVPKRGYRFVSAVEVQAQARRSLSEPGIDSAGVHRLQPERRFDPRLAWGVAVLLTLSAGGVGMWFARSGPKTLTPLKAIPLTTYVGSEFQPSFSPDGNQVAFTWNGEKQENLDVYVKLIGTSEPLRLTRDPGADWSPVWSPDGRSIAFLRIFTEGFALMTASPLGGSEQKLMEVHGRAGGYLRGPYLTWSQDGKALVFSYSEFLGEPTGLFLLFLESRDKRRLTRAPTGSIGDSAPAFSPDGHTLAFNRMVDVGTSDLYLLTLSNDLKPIDEPRRITFTDREAYSPTWNARASEIIYESIPGLWRITVGSTDKPQRLPWFGEDGHFPVVSRKGDRLAYSRSLQDINIWRAELSGSRGQTSHPAKFSSSTFIDAEAQFSPDGKRVVFSSNRSGSDEIWVCDSNGSNAIALTSFGGPQLGSPRWSPDGKRIAFDANIEGQFDIQIINADGGRPHRLTANAPHNFTPGWSHDGKWIYFGSTRSGKRQVWKMPAEGGEAARVTQKGGFLPLESHNDGFIYYLKSEDKDQESFSTSLWKISTQGGEETQVIESVAKRAATVVKDGIYFVPRRNPGGAHTIQFLDFAAGRSRVVATIEMPVSYGLSVSPDRKWILYSQVDQAGSDLMLVENFR
jgi:Tol biopolymer transport system component/DNA-binding winged helix-turn-helix (wHTH) protein